MTQPLYQETPFTMSIKEALVAAGWPEEHAHGTIWAALGAERARWDAALARAMSEHLTVEEAERHQRDHGGRAAQGCRMCHAVYQYKRHRDRKGKRLE